MTLGSTTQELALQEILKRHKQNRRNVSYGLYEITIDAFDFNMMHDAAERSITLEAENKILREVLEWYGTKWLYGLTEYNTAAPLYSIDNPKNVVVQGNPIMNDEGKKARDVLEKLK